jgi:hypothetical protein
MSGLDEVRLEVSRAHRLPDAATNFLTGETVERIEEQAAELAKLGASTRADLEPATHDLIGTARAAKHERRQTLLAALAGHREQPRDRRGQYASFDGGARAPVPTRGDPQAEHTELAARLIGESRQSRGPADVGRHF